jgi:hypothetical protein
MPCHAMPCHAMPRHATPQNTAAITPAMISARGRVPCTIPPSQRLPPAAAHHGGRHAQPSAAERCSRCVMRGAHVDGRGAPARQRRGAARTKVGRLATGGARQCSHPVSRGRSGRRWHGGVQATAITVAVNANARMVGGGWRGAGREPRAMLSVNGWADRAHFLKAVHLQVERLRTHRVPHAGGVGRQPVTVGRSVALAICARSITAGPFGKPRSVCRRKGETTQQKSHALMPGCGGHSPRFW